MPRSALITGSAPRSSGVVRIASIPSSHVYVRHLTSTTDDAGAVRRLPDPVPEGRTPEQSSWWPPVMLDAGWIARHADTFDVFHVHFGFDAVTADDLREVVDALQRHGKPLVLTVHDLRNPHHVDRAAHDAQLDVLVPAADRLLTLTRGAADEVAWRWGRRPDVVPHPHVVELDVAERLRADRVARDGGRGTFRVGVHLKSLRAGMDVTTVLPALERVVGAMPDAVLQVDVHREAVEPQGSRHDARLAAAVAALGPSVDLRVHDYFSDDELWGYLGALDASVLPYRFGTHSGWLEACRDLGTQVVAPSCGFYADQAPVHSFVLEETPSGELLFDERSLARAVLASREAPTPSPTLDERRQQRERVASFHHAVYREVTGA